MRTKTKTLVSKTIVAYWEDNSGKLHRGVVAKCNGESVLIIPASGPAEWVDSALLTSVNLQNDHNDD